MFNVFYSMGGGFGQSTSSVDNDMEVLRSNNLSNSETDCDGSDDVGRTAKADSNSTLSARRKLRRAKSQMRKVESGYNISVEMPGVNRADVDVKVEGGYLVVKGNYKTDVDQTNYWDFWSVSSNVSVEGITANYENGILNLFVPTLGITSKTIYVD
jgi:HSP20 family molecular chaperone IbpA